MTGDKQHDATSEFNEALAAGFAARNFDGLGPFYTEDARILPPRGKLLDGRGAASTFWRGVANRFASATFTTVDLKPLGDTARREAGTYVMATADGTPTEGKYVFVWQLVEGEWQIESAIWNRNGEPAAGGRRPGQGQGQRQGGAGPGAGGQGGGQGGYRRGGNQGGGGQGGGGQGGYRQGGGAGGPQGGGYRQGGGRPSFQAGGGGAGGPRQGQGGGRRGGQGGQGGGGGSLYEGNGGLYTDQKD